jgi:nitrite reductase/ring-hydroxylating ferredoxin subunit
MEDAEPNWVFVCDRAALSPGAMREVEAGGAALLLYDVDGAVFATDAICPHHAAWLSQGGVDGAYVDCPRHQGRFHIPTGAKVRGPECPDLRTYAVRVEAGRVLVAL